MIYKKFIPHHFFTALKRYYIYRKFSKLKSYLFINDKIKNFKKVKKWWGIKNKKMEEINFSRGVGSDNYRDDSSRFDMKKYTSQDEKESESVGYVPEGIPAEAPEKSGGRSQGVVSIVCAGISLVFIPILFGVLGIVMGALSKDRGAKTLGLVGIILSAVFMVIGLGLSLYLNFRENAAVGYMGHLFVNSLN